ncbi:MAG: transcriptional repressor [Promethearchaeota archaeon]
MSLSKKSDGKISASKSFKIGDLANLSIVEILTLQRLLQHQKPVVRYILYQEINQLIHPDKKKYNSAEEILSNSLKEERPDLSTSSFYNSLNTLKKKGLVAFNYKLGIKKQIETIEATKTTRLAILALEHYFLRTTVSDFGYLLKVGEKILDIIGQSHLETLITVWLSDILDLNLLEYFTKIANEVSILSKVDIYEDLVKIGLKNINYTNMYNNVIREPNEFFNLAVVPSYKRNLDFFGLSRIDLLKELIRVTKKDGVIIISGRTAFSSTQNFYADELLKRYSESISERIFSERELKDEMFNAGLSKVETYNFEGLIIAIGWVT